MKYGLAILVSFAIGLATQRMWKLENQNGDSVQLTMHPEEWIGLRDLVAAHGGSDVLAKKIVGVAEDAAQRTGDASATITNEQWQRIVGCVVRNGLAKLAQGQAGYTPPISS